MIVNRRTCTETYKLHLSCSYRVGVGILFNVRQSVGSALGGWLSWAWIIVCTSVGPHGSGIVVPEHHNCGMILPDFACCIPGPQC